MEGFVHLHVHSQYSLLDGAVRLEDKENHNDMVATAKKLGMDSIALTDHGNLFGAVEFYNAAKAGGIKPILGMEAYISPTTRTDRSMGRQDTAAYHLILLAQNIEGWKNLIKLSSIAYLEGFYYKPRIDMEILAKYNKGLICTTACLGGQVPSALLNGDTEGAKKIASQYLDIFGPERFFIEVQSQGIEDQDKVNPLLIAIAKGLGVGVVGTNDVHFLRREDKPSHEVLTAISTGKTLADGGALHYPPELYLKSPAEMRQALRDLPVESADNTLKIAEMCNVELDFKSKYLPVFHLPKGTTADEHLRKVAFAGMERRIGKNPAQEYIDRMEMELKVIADKGYSSYFLIINDFVTYAKQNNIPCGARGSGVATLLGYCLDISHSDPIRYGLLFQRFTDPERKEDPDIDVDICQDGRAKVLQYVRQKYGHVAQIITYGTLGAKAAIKDVGRVMDIPLSEVNAITAKIPGGPNVALGDSISAEPELRSLAKSDERIQKMFDHALALEGLARHSGVHAAGVVIADQPLDTIVPLCKQADSDDAITQWDGPTCEKVGLMKMDLLGLRTLTIIQRARDLVQANGGPNLDAEALPLDDDKVYELFRLGHTDGVFQFESEGMKNILIQMRPTRIEDLIAANAMYRPGPMELIPTYCARKNGVEKVPSVHALVDELLAETYGIMCYQEQVMQVLNRLGKLPLNRALTLIKAISKKKESVIASERPNFLEGARTNGISEAEAERLFELILKFAGYGFNKAHSTRYAVLAYQTAYFKVHYPKEFLAATLTAESGATDKIVQYITEAGRMGIKVAPPDINACGADFTVDGPQVRFGLAAVKGVGAKAVDAIVEVRKTVGKFNNLFHFCENVDLHAVNSKTIESLIKCGAFDALGANRAAMIAAMDKAMELGNSVAEAKRSGQMSFFGAEGFAPAAADAKPNFPNVEPWSEAQLLSAEKETLGFYITSHPLVHHGRELSSLSQPREISLGTLEGSTYSGTATIGCAIAAVRQVVVKKGRSEGRKMAILTIEDLSGKCDATVFCDEYERLGPLIKADALVFIRGEVDRSRERPGFIVKEIIPMDQAIEQLTASFTLRLPAEMTAADALAKIQSLLEKHKGSCPINLECRPASRQDVIVRLKTDRKWSVAPSRKLIDDHVEMLGDQKNILLTPKPQPVAQNNRFGGNGKKFYRSAPPKGQVGQASAAVTRFN